MNPGLKHLFDRQRVTLLGFIFGAQDPVQLRQQLLHLDRRTADKLDMNACLGRSRHPRLAAGYWTRSNTAAMPWPTPTHIVTRA